MGNKTKAENINSLLFVIYHAHSFKKWVKSGLLQNKKALKPTVQGLFGGGDEGS